MYKETHNSTVYGSKIFISGGLIKYIMMQQPKEYYMVT